MSFAVVVELAGGVAFGVVLLGGRQKREVGWKVLGWLLGVAAVTQMVAMAVVVSTLLSKHVFRASECRKKREFGSKAFQKNNVDNLRVQAFLYDHDERFTPGWRLDVSWILCTLSWCILTLDLTGIITAALVLPSEGDYELIPDRPVHHMGA